MKYIYNKLVRDKIPEEINKIKGRTAIYEIMDDNEYVKELNKKLLEEANEYIADNSIEELADLMEVVEAIMINTNIEMSQIQEKMKIKRDKKGGFKDKIYLKYVEENEKNIEENHLQEKQEQLLNRLNNTDDLRKIQQYIKNVIDIRGFGNQPIQDTMLLLLEEVGELAKAIRKNATGMSIDKNKICNYDTIESEIADVFIVLSSICNKLNIDMYNSLVEKEMENIKRNWE